MIQTSRSGDSIADLQVQLVQFRYSDIKHTLLYAVSYDGDNELVHLAYGVCDVENTENWEWFISKLIDDFPAFT